MRRNLLILKLGEGDHLFNIVWRCLIGGMVIGLIILFIFTCLIVIPTGLAILIKYHPMIGIPITVILGILFIGFCAEFCGEV